ncbi:RHS repeat-associated core domain-containing protein [Capnocytophaga ochracea]|uniref:RHS repeat domain-containing protein n=1 Tax=Capnocytophaga TaxID=1016 RepID=UPI002B49356C|nr:RHS repeat-associated core domain-containing protein [Capnocytophaga ochracea]MEB3036040.1 RHS repeat-associated core domain-containing protein [Capnocytophaga ochracea]
MIAERRHFDPWGQPIKVEDGAGNTLDKLTLLDRLDRGFTGHKHLQTVGLISMNGRLYDPALHRFLQPDNYVQDPFNTQNFNRYGYCLNNPLVYVDENGEIIELIFGLGNLIARAKRGSIHNFWDGVGAFFQGFLAGAVAGPDAMASISSLNLSGAVQGLLTGIFSDDWKVFRNSFKIALGNFYIDENRTFMGELWQGISRHTWELPQTSIGTNYSQFMNMSDEVDRVEYLGGATFSINEESEGSDYGITIGSFIKMNIKDKIECDFTEYVLTHPLFMHEYGHYIDSQRMGLTYLINVELPSLISAGTSEEIDGEPRWVNTHSFRWYEMNANKNAERYFNKHYGNRIIWNERDYPRHKRLKR